MLLRRHLHRMWLKVIRLKLMRCLGWHLALIVGPSTASIKPAIIISAHHLTLSEAIIITTASASHLTIIKATRRKTTTTTTTAATVASKTTAKVGPITVAHHVRIRIELAPAKAAIVVEAPAAKLWIKVATVVVHVMLLRLLLHWRRKAVERVVIRVVKGPTSAASATASILKPSTTTSHRTAAAAAAPIPAHAASVNAAATSIRTLSRLAAPGATSTAHHGTAPAAHAISATTRRSTARATTAPTTASLLLMMLAAVLRLLALVRLGGGEFDAEAPALPQRVVQTGYGRLGAVRVFHVDEAKVFEYVAFGDFAELFEQLLELGAARRRRYVANVDFDGRWHVFHLGEIRRSLVGVFYFILGVSI